MAVFLVEVPKNENKITNKRPYVVGAVWWVVIWSGDAGTHLHIEVASLFRFNKLYSLSIRTCDCNNK